MCSQGSNRNEYVVEAANLLKKYSCTQSTAIEINQRWKQLTKAEEITEYIQNGFIKTKIANTCDLILVLDA